MILLFDFSKVLLFPRDDNYTGSLNTLYKEQVSQLNFNFFDYFKLNTVLLDYLKQHQNEMELYMFTSESIQNAPELQPYIKPVFKQIFSALDMPYSKKENKAYVEIANMLNASPSEITFIDDSAENINAAKIAGLNTIQFVANEDLLEQLKEN